MSDLSRRGLIGSAALVGLLGASVKETEAGNPTDVLATNFGKPALLFEKFPRTDVFIAP
jgi:hypothetical protein